MKSVFTLRRVAALTVLIGISTTMPAQTTDHEIQALREQIRLLDQKLRVLERKEELRDEAAAAAAPTTPKVTVNDKGFTLASADAANSFRLRGLVQLDSRLFLNDGGVVNNSFVLRRAQLKAEAVFAKNYSFLFVSDFGGSSVSVLDANLTVAVTKGLQFKVGKCKPPIGFEQIQSDSLTFFNERSAVSALMPNRDLGIQLTGDLHDGVVGYAIGAFGGVPDGASTTNSDFDNDKDFVGRVTVAPFKNVAGSVVQGLTLGLGGSLGRQKTASGRASSYRTDGQQLFFTYLVPSIPSIADGPVWRISPGFDFRHGPLGLLGEYVVSTVNLRPSAGAPKSELRHHAWQLSGGYVLTGEDSTPLGVAPKTNFDLSNGTWGAFEVAGRYSDLTIDDEAFPTFASPSASADGASAVGVGLNWYLSKAVRFTFDYYQTRFRFNSAAPAVSATPILRQDEKAFITRFQLGF
jgi:phosphate-selective porin OprO/OprP